MAVSEEITVMFQLFDKKGEGSVNHEQMTSFLTSLGYHMTKKEIDDVISRYDVNKSNALEIEEFAEMTKDLMTSVDDITIKLAYDAFDPDGHGYVTKRQVERILQNLSIRISKSDLEEMMGDVGDYITYQQFVDVITK
uniref:calmodulin-like n=1 Tax=Ciona intestinalis TaxID=7719 RepID=UPI000180B3CD|nr:calmodulin-like [Ciona intestinalis]|eukprot:XP_002119282.1 calmodulin-like [Ciona intestinalis]